MSNKFERQLKQLLESDVEKEVNDLPDAEEEEEQQIEELLPVEFEEKESGVSIDTNPDLDKDYKFARSNYYGLIGRTNSAIDLAMKIAAMSEHPRAMEVAANLMKTSSDITKDLIALQKSIDDKNQPKQGEKQQGTYVQNNHYYGDKSPTDIENELDGLSDEENKK